MQEASLSLEFGAVRVRLFFPKLGGMRSLMRPSVRRSEVKMGEDGGGAWEWLEIVLPMLEV